MVIKKSLNYNISMRCTLDESSKLESFCSEKLKIVEKPRIS